MSRELGSVLAAAEDIGKAGPVGLFLILSLLIVVFFLGRSMRTHLRRVPSEFPDNTSPFTGGPGAAAQDGRVLEGEVLDRPNDSQAPIDGQMPRPETPRPETPGPETPRPETPRPNSV